MFCLGATGALDKHQHGVTGTVVVKVKFFFFEKVQKLHFLCSFSNDTLFVRFFLFFWTFFFAPVCFCIACRMIVSSKLMISTTMALVLMCKWFFEQSWTFFSSFFVCFWFFFLFSFVWGVEGGGDLKMHGVDLGAIDPNRRFTTECFSHKVWSFLAHSTRSDLF